jgi:hypothetical protein
LANEVVIAIDPRDTIDLEWMVLIQCRNIIFFDSDAVNLTSILWKSLFFGEVAGEPGPPNPSVFGRQ